MDKGRFSLLLLEPGEIYFEDFSACLIPSDTTTKNYELNKQTGRLRMCSKSLVFDPQDLTKPIVKIPLKDCTILEQYKGNAKFLSNKNVLSVCCKQYIEMLEGNIIAPYKFCGMARFLFLLNYANIGDSLSRITQLQRASTLPAADQADMIATIVHSRQARVRFDPLWLDLYEKVVMETQADKVTPLVVNPGRILLSTARLFFQPYNNIETYPVLKINLGSIKQIIKRRFLLRHIGLEIYSGEDHSVPYIYLAFRSQVDRDNLYTNILKQSDLRLCEIEQDVMTLQWQNGYVTNYDYLLYINSLADRTINDLTQYPVFPWVVADYKSKTLDLNNPETYRDLSKPVGALNEERLQRLIDRYDEMSYPKFIYGSHYSTPAFVLFYLVRLYPQYVLCLQNGRFDHPDRMFNSCEDVYRNCLSNMSDFKELIPEFYNVEQGGDFLVNSMGINLGVRYDGSKVDDVALPAWADDPKHFVKTLRDALESDYVSENLHLWIDLIFGYKQRGEEAEKARNLFYYVCYEGNVDLDSINDLNKKHALEVQIMEFGQIPKQLFKVPHCQRRTKLQLLKPVLTEDVQKDSLNPWKSMSSLKLESVFNTHKDTVSSLFVANNENQIMSAGYDSKLKVFSLSQNRQIRSANVGNMPLSSLIQLPNMNVIVIGSFDNNIILYDLDFGKVTQTVNAHEDAVTCLAWGNKCKLLASGSSDCTVKIWKSFSKRDVIKPVQCLQKQLVHNSQVNCLSFSPKNDYLASATDDGGIFLWNMSTYLLHKKFKIHTSAVKSISFSPDGQKLVSCGSDKVFQVIDINTGMPLYNKTLSSVLISLKWEDFILLIGSEDGILYVWDIVEVKLLYQTKAHTGGLKVVDISMKHSFIVTGGEDHAIKIWKPYRNVLIRISEIGFNWIKPSTTFQDNLLVMFASLKNKIREETGSDISKLTAKITSSTAQRIEALRGRSQQGSTSSINSLVSSDGNREENVENSKTDEEYKKRLSKLENEFASKLEEKTKEWQNVVVEKDKRIQKLEKEQEDAFKQINSLKDFLKSSEELQKKLVEHREDKEQIENFQMQELSKIKHLVLLREQELAEKSGLLKDTVQQLEKMRSEVTRLRRQEERLSDIQDDLESFRHSSARDLAALATELAKSEEERRHLTDLVAVLRQRTSSNSDGNDQENQERKLLEQRLEEAHLHLADIKTSWSDKIASLETQVGRLSRQAAEESAERRRAVQEKEQFAEKVKQMECELECNLLEINNKEAKIRRLTNEVEEMSKELKSLQADSEEEIAFLRQKIQDAGTEIKAVRKNLENTECQFEKSEEECSKLKLSVDSEHQANKSLRQLITKLEKELNEEKSNSLNVQKTLTRVTSEKNVALLRNAEVSQQMEMAKQEYEIKKYKEKEAESREQDLKNTITRLEDQLTEKNKTIKTLQLRLADVKKTLQQELKTPGSINYYNDMSDVNPAAVLLPSHTSTKTYQHSIRKDDDDINFKYLKHVLIKFLTSREYEAQHLIRAVSTLLKLSPEEEQLLHDTLEWKMSWFGPKPKVGNGQTATNIPSS
ncbi:hypothetical protein FQR65_LT01213 [Abscondita terminalis]|nr:hypothetical protein FQR65_LT01213 [Abscondita terminalis]